MFVVGFVVAALGLAIAFFGRLLFKGASFLLGGILGAVIGLGIGTLLGLPLLFTILLAAVLAAVGAVLSHHFAMTLVAMYLSTLAGAGAYQAAAFLLPGSSWLVYLLVAFVAGFAAFALVIRLFDKIIAFATAALGGYLAGAGLAWGLGMEGWTLAMGLAGLVLIGAAGTAFQLTRHDDRHRGPQGRGRADRSPTGRSVPGRRPR